MLNLQSDGGRELLKKLVASADAFVQSFRREVFRPHTGGRLRPNYCQLPATRIPFGPSARMMRCVSSVRKRPSGRSNT